MVRFFDHSTGGKASGGDNNATWKYLQTQNNKT